MFEFTLWPSGTERDARVVVGVLSVAYVVGLAIFLVAGPFVVSGMSGVPLGSAVEIVVGIVGIGYAIAGLLLLR